MPAQELTVRTANVAALAIETGDGASGACLAAGPVILRLSTDGPLELRFDDGRTVTVAAAGDHEVVVPSVADLRGDGDDNGNGGDAEKGGRPSTNPGKGPGGGGPPGGPGGPGGGKPNGGDAVGGAPVSSAAPLAAGVLPAALAALASAVSGLALAGRRRRVTPSSPSTATGSGGSH